MNICDKCHENTATREVVLANHEQNLYLSKEVCEPCRDLLCDPIAPLAGATIPGVGRVPLYGTDCGGVKRA